MSEAPKTPNLLEVKNLKQYFDINMGFFRSKPLKAVDDVSFSIKKGETLGLVGESGCGKTTVGRTILHLYKPTAGEVIFDGKPIKTKIDIAENPKNLEILEIEAAQLTRSLQDVDLAVINGNYAIQGGLSVGKDAIAAEDKDSLAAETYANIIAVKEGNENSEKTKALVEVLQSEEVRAFIDATYDGAVIAKF